MAENILAAFAEALAAGSIRVVDLTQSLQAGHSGHPIAAGIRQVLAVSPAGNFEIRFARPGVVLEQFLLRRAHRHAL